MERLTKKGNEIFNYGEFNNKYTVDNQHISCALTDENYKKKDCCYIGNAIDKLAEFEDFMEENGFESLEELQKHIELINDYYNEIKNTGTCGFCEHLDNKENQTLKDRWQKLKEWVEKKYVDNYIDANDTKSPLTTQEYYGGSADSCRKTLDKMKELERR